MNSRQILFKDFITLQRGFDLPNQSRELGQIPIIASTGICGYHNQSKVKAPGVVTGRSGSLGAVQYLNVDFWPLNTSLWVKDFKGNLPKYVYYYLKTMKLDQFNSGAGVPTLNRNDLDAVVVRLHDNQSQEKITEILSAYDDLIENNSRRIAILEEMAQRLYREWFVHFRFPGHKGTNMVESDMGLIPENWTISSPQNVSDYYIGGGWGKDIRSNGLVPAYVVRGTDIPQAKRNDIAGCPLRYHTKSNFQSRVLKDGDIVIEVSGGSKGQPVGRALLITDELLNSFDHNAICASFCKLFRCNKNISSYYFYMWLQEIYENREIEKYQSQSTGIINFQFEYFLYNATLLVPPKALQEKFELFCGTLFRQINILGAKNTNLRKTRDLLLPRLISGDIDVSELPISEKED